MSDYKDNNELFDDVKKVSRELIENKYDETIKKTLKNYVDFISVMIDSIEQSNSRQSPKAVNLFTTNYDLFVEKSVDSLLNNKRFVFNDGANGYFVRTLDSSNYNKTTSYKGLNDNFLDEIVTINLFKPHGSVNWERNGNHIIVKNEVSDNFVGVPPTGVENSETFINDHFHNMLRLFQFELDKQQSLLIVIGFSFQDSHIAAMVKRALKNPELLVIVFCHDEKTDKDGKTEKDRIYENLDVPNNQNNLMVVVPSEIDTNDGEKIKEFIIANLTELILNNKETDCE
ncbi:MAG: SIR2 family protein [Erysipelotrichaceae bacterium]|nr:SIR2 family protein [Erysipelotrichaceae bacterium]